MSGNNRLTKRDSGGSGRTTLILPLQMQSVADRVRALFRIFRVNQPAVNSRLEETPVLGTNLPNRPDPKQQPRRKETCMTENPALGLLRPFTLVVLASLLVFQCPKAQAQDNNGQKVVAAYF